METGNQPENAEDETRTHGVVGKLTRRHFQKAAPQANPKGTTRIAFEALAMLEQNVFRVCVIITKSQIIATILKASLTKVIWV